MAAAVASSGGAVAAAAEVEGEAAKCQRQHAATTPKAPTQRGEAAKCKLRHAAPVGNPVTDLRGWVPSGTLSTPQLALLRQRSGAGGGASRLTPSRSPAGNHGAATVTRPRSAAGRMRSPPMS